MKAVLLSPPVCQLAAVLGATLIACWLLARICAGAANPRDELRKHGLD